MTTNKETQYDKDENALVDLIESMRENYNINLDDIRDILKDRF